MIVCPRISVRISRPKDMLRDHTAEYIILYVCHISELNFSAAPIGPIEPIFWWNVHNDRWTLVQRNMINHLPQRDYISAEITQKTLKKNTSNFIRWLPSVRRPRPYMTDWCQTFCPQYNRKKYHEQKIYGMLWLCICIAAHWHRLYKSLELGMGNFSIINLHLIVENKLKVYYNVYCLNSYLALQCS